MTFLPITDFAFCLWGIHKLGKDLRLAAAQRFEPLRSLVLNWLPFKGKTEQASRDDRWQSLAG